MSEDFASPPEKELSDHERICQAAVRLAATNGMVNSDDVREAVTITVDKRVIGGALSLLSRRKILAKIGIKPTTQPGSGSRDIAVFALTQDWRKNYAQTPSLDLPGWMMGLEATRTVQTDAEQDALVHLESLLAAVDAVDPATGHRGPWQHLAELRGRVAKARAFTSSIRQARGEKTT